MRRREEDESNVLFTTITYDGGLKKINTFLSIVLNKGVKANMIFFQCWLSHCLLSSLCAVTEGQNR